jgi:uncharacterized protein
MLGPVSYERGLKLIRAGAYFEAHEELETAWRAAELAERDFLQGLVHVAVAWYQAGRGNRAGCERQLEKAARRLGPYLPEHRGLDVAELVDQVERAAARASSGDLALHPVKPNRLEDAVDRYVQPPRAIEEEQ